MRALLHLLKYERMEPVALRLGARMAAQVAGLPALPGALTVVPVPLFAGKRRERGYNQAELLARAAVHAGRARGLDWKLDTGLLRRTRSTESQAGLSPRQRRENVRGAFSSPDSGGLKGRDVLLIDDIYTTGATARAASRALRLGGAASVWVATAARAQRLEAVPLPELPMREDVASWS